MGKFVIRNDSKSLYNHSLAPGWTTEDCVTLRALILKYGVGKWRQIHTSGLLPGKTSQQLNLQTQRLLGQQSIREFMGLKIDTKMVFLDNSNKTHTNDGTPVLRKGGLIIDQEGSRTEGELKRLVAENKRKYEEGADHSSFVPIMEEMEKRVEAVSPYSALPDAKGHRPLSLAERRARLVEAIEGTKLDIVINAVRKTELRTLLAPVDEVRAIAAADLLERQNPTPVELLRRLMKKQEGVPRPVKRRRREVPRRRSPDAWDSDEARGPSPVFDEPADAVPRVYRGQRRAGQAARDRLKVVADDFFFGQYDELELL